MCHVLRVAGFMFMFLFYGQSIEHSAALHSAAGGCYV
jgi:hypothetical protein